MGYNGAEMCERIVIYMLYLIRKRYDSKYIGYIVMTDQTYAKLEVNQPQKKQKNSYSLCLSKKAYK